MKRREEMRREKKREVVEVNNSLGVRQEPESELATHHSGYDIRICANSCDSHTCEH